MTPAEKRILTRHPGRKKGVNIGKAKYELMRRAIAVCLKRRELTHTELLKAVEKSLAGKFDGSIPWYFETVKLDLEARGVLSRLSGEKPPKYRLK